MKRGFAVLTSDAQAWTMSRVGPSDLRKPR